MDSVDFGLNFCLEALHWKTSALSKGLVNSEGGNLFFIWNPAIVTFLGTLQGQTCVFRFSRHTNQITHTPERCYGKKNRDDSRAALQGGGYLPGMQTSQSLSNGRLTAQERHGFLCQRPNTEAEARRGGIRSV